MVPTPCYNDAYLVGTPKWAFLEKDWLKHCKTMISPFIGRLFLVSKRTFYFWWVIRWMLHIGRARHPGPGPRVFMPGQLSIEFVASEACFVTDRRFTPLFFGFCSLSY